MTLTLTSPAFAAGRPIPRQYSCQGQDQSPPLTWDEPPPGTAGWALIVDDPDAPGGTWVHWVCYNLPAATRSLPAAASTAATWPDGTRNGTNSWGRSGYGGPCPPSGTHHYMFKLYALDAMLALPAGARKEQLLAAMQDHILAQGQLMGTYHK